MDIMAASVKPPGVIMNSKDKPNGKANPSKPVKVMPLMTPRNLVPATPMRFSGGEGAAKPTDTVPASTKRTVKEKSIPLAPGYVDRAAQRRSGLEAMDIFTLERAEPGNREETDLKGKMKFIEEDPSGFPQVNQIQFENVMKIVLLPAEKVKKSSNFTPNEAFLQFKSIEEAKTQPSNLPKKVFRATTRNSNHEDGEDGEVLERVKEAMKRLKIASERNQKYLETLRNDFDADQNSFSTDIFPEVGRFDEKAELETIIQTTSVTKNTKEKVKNRLFSKSRATNPTPAPAEEIDVFELIAQKPLDESKKNQLETVKSGGLFGYTDILPKLSRLEDEKQGKELTGAYASIMTDENDDTAASTADTKISYENTEEDYLDPMAFDSDEEGPIDNETMPKNKRKLARKEDKEAAKVEKLVKSKFGVDLTK